MQYLFLYITRHVICNWYCHGYHHFFVYLNDNHKYIELFDLPDPNYVKKASQLKVVDKKLPIEAESRDAGASDDSCMIYHYPVEGRDSTSGYASIFYIGKEKYENAEVGEKIWINVEYAD